MKSILSTNFSIALRTFSPSSASVSVIITLAPDCANSSAIARPKPRAAPVTIATLPKSSRVDPPSIVLSLLQGGLFRPRDATAQKIVKHRQIPGAPLDRRIELHQRLHVVVTAAMAQCQI